MRIIAREQAGSQPVYDIGVPVTHNFVLDNGLVSHNCFNKSHSIAYSTLTYICAWLKANHPIEFFCALMTIRSRSLQPKDWAMKAPQYINEAKLLNVNIHPPTINSSNIGFIIDNDSIFFGLNAIKDVGLTGARSIAKSRGQTPFKDIIDFISRVSLSKVNVKTFRALVKAGAFDRMGYRRTDLLANTQSLYDWVKNLQIYHERDIINRQRILENKRTEPVIAKRNDLRRIQKLKRERDLTQEEEEFLADTKGLRKKILFKHSEPPKVPTIPRYSSISLDVVELMQQAEYIGCYIGVHPASIVYPNSIRIAEAELGHKQSLAGAVSSIKVIQDRNGREMAFMSYGDGTGIAEAVIFSHTFAKLKAQNNLPEPGELIETFGMVDQIDPEVKIKLFSIQKYRSDT